MRSEDRISLNTQTFYEFGPFRLDPRERVLLRNGESVPLPPKAFDLLVVMADRAGRLVTKEELLTEVWQGTFVEDANLTYTVSLLRKALADDAEPHAFIETVSKRGYRFRGAVTRRIDHEPAVESHARRPAIWLLWSVVVTLLLAFASWLVVHRREPDSSAPLLRMAVTPPPGVTVENAQISPDGQWIAFIGREGDAGTMWTLTTRLWVQRLDSTDASALPGTESALSPFWAPDSQTIAFIAGGALKKMNVSGGPAEKLSPVTPFVGGSWGRAGVILIRTGPFEPISQIPASGGVPVPVTKVDPSGKDQHLWPHFLPDGRHFLYIVHSDDQTRSGLYAGSLDSIEVNRRLLDVETPAIYGAPGYLLYSRDGSIVARPFDLTRLEFTGVASPIAYDREYVSRFGPPVFSTTRRSVGLGIGSVTTSLFGAATFSASDSGRLSYSLFEPYQYQFAWFDRGGKALGNVGEPGAFSTFDLSTDGRRVVVARAKTDRVNLWVLDVERGRFAQVSFEDAFEFDPRWGPDGRRVAWTSTKDGVRRIMQRTLDGQETEVLRPGVLHDWSPDGRYLIYGWYGRFAFSLSDKKQIPLFFGAQPKAGEQASFSRDGRLIAYSSDVSGRFEVYVQTFPPAGEPQQVSVDGGVQPVWRQDGRELYYLGLDGTLFAVDVDGRTLKLTAPRSLFKAPVGPLRFEIEQYATVDGQRFLFLTPVSRQRRPINVIINWPAAINSQNH